MSSKKEWFGEWFDSKYYHILYKHRDHEDARRFIDSICELIQPDSESIILDLACGKGRHAIYLNEKGFNVVGLDLSEKNIASAKKWENDHLHFYTHDMRKVWRENEFDYVLNLFTSFGYFRSDLEDEQVIQAVSRSLKNGGKFILDFLNPYAVINGLVPDEIKRIDEIEFHITRYFEDGFIFKKITFSDNGSRYSFYEKVKAIRRVRFLDYFKNANLKLLNIMGDYNLNPYVAEKSERMIFYLEK